MDVLKKLVLRLFDIVEIYIPSVCMAVTFVSFVIQIFSRYVLKAQVGWSYETTLIGFLWCLVLAASNGSRSHTHVAFTLFYDKCGEKGRLGFRIFAGIFIVVSFSILLGPAWEYVAFMKIKKTSVTKIPMNILFFPFIVFTALTLIHTIKDLILDIRLLCRKLSGKEVQAK
jgi:TRAP-type C4-dicarboxylate transport system permease small subunit